MLSYDCPSPISGSFARRSSPDTLHFPLFVSRLSRRADGWESSRLVPGLLFIVSTPLLLTYDKETMGAPKFPSCPFECMPRS